MASKRGLGKGIDSIIPKGSGVKNNVKSNAAEAVNISDTDKVVSIKLTSIERDKSQPRKNFSEDELNELADSIKEHGIFQPLLVRKKEDYFEIVAGERRWRAAKIAGLKEVPCLVKDYSEQEKFEIQLIENIQREDLDPIEEAAAYKRLIEEFHLKQDELAERIGKKRTTITNSMRLLNLSEPVQGMLIEKKITPGHARALLTIEDEEQQYEMAQKVFDEKLSVRDVEKEVKALNKPKKEKKLTPEALQLIYKGLEDRIREKLQARIKINPRDEQKGRIEIEYNSQNELEEIVKRITGI